MQIVIIGSGNVATVLSRLFKQKGHTILQIISRNIDNAKILAEELNCDYTNYSGQTNMNADLYLVAISDGVLFDLNKSFKLQDKLIVHTAGSVPKDVLEGISTNYGIFYPFQSLRKEVEALPEMPILVDGCNEKTIVRLEEFAKSISSIVRRTTDEEKAKLHVSGVFVSNFTNHLYSLAADFCAKENIDFELLYPLMKQTAQRATQFAPETVQTGPAIRKDVFTLDKHLKVLVNHPSLKYIYLKLTDSIMNWRN
jgi:predicted short-subunit dehydrogenase-like oxidoreductase (DUF2520 family)